MLFIIQYYKVKSSLLIRSCFQTTCHLRLILSMLSNILEIFLWMSHIFVSCFQKNRRNLTLFDLVFTLAISYGCSDVSWNISPICIQYIDLDYSSVFHMTWFSAVVKGGRTCVPLISIVLYSIARLSL